MSRALSYSAPKSHSNGVVTSFLQRRKTEARSEPQTAHVPVADAVARGEREALLSLDDATAANGRLRGLASAWQEVLATEPVRNTAQRLLRTHPLRSADSLQLAAAIVAAEFEPGSLEFVCLDDRLNEAAMREGFRIVKG